jgi:hypothetical protein
MSLLLIAITTLFAAQSVACSCVGRPGTIAEEYQLSDKVFLGTVQSVGFTANGYQRLAVIQVEQSWKGYPGALVLVVTEVNSAACGVEFLPGQSWVVFGTDTMYDGGEAVYTHICTLAVQEEYAGAIMAELQVIPVQQSAWGRLKASYR